MDKHAVLETEWSKLYARMARTEYFRRLADCSLEMGHYKGFLRESYHNTRQNPRIMALFIAHLKSDNAALRSKFLKHTAMEMGHDEMALEDLKFLGEDIEPIRESRPLVATEALAGFIMTQIQHRNPLSFLGYSYHLETLPVRIGEMATKALLKVGVPAEALSFLKEHVSADPVHTKWNREYIDGFVRTEADMEAVLYGMRGSCELHAMMFQGILDSAGTDTQSWSAVTQNAAHKSPVAAKPVSK